MIFIMQYRRQVEQSISVHLLHKAMNGVFCVWWHSVTLIHLPPDEKRLKDRLNSALAHTICASQLCHVHMAFTMVHCMSQ